MKLRYIIIKVKDIERAKKFYSTFLKMESTKEEVGRMVVFDLENIKIGLYNPLADGGTLLESDFVNNCFPAFGTENMELELKRISAFADITSQGKIDNHEWFEFKDSEGNILEIHKV